MHVDLPKGPALSVGLLLGLLLEGSAAAARPKRPTPAPLPSATEVTHVKETGILDPPLRFGRLSVEDGLPAAGVRAIVQDREGFLWFGTEGGIARYDGVKFKVFAHDRDNPESLVENIVTSMAVDSDGMIWVGTQVGLDRFNPKTEKFEHFRASEIGSKSLVDDNISSLLVTRSGAVWIGTSGGLHRHDPENEGFVVAKALQGVPIRTVIESPEGALYVGTNQNGVIKYDARAQKILTTYLHDPRDSQSLSGDSISTLHLDSSNILWIGTDGFGLNALDLSTGKVRRYRHDEGNPRSLAMDHVGSIIEDKQGRLWIGTRFGLNQYNEARDDFEHHKANTLVPDMLAYPWVTSAFIDRAGVVWIGLLTGAVSYFDPLRVNFAAYRWQSSQPLSFADDGKGTLWMGNGTALDMGLLKINMETREYVRYRRLGVGSTDEVTLDSVIIWSLHLDERGILWIGTHGPRALIAFNTRTEAFQRFEIGDKDADAGESNGISAMVEVEGNLYLGTLGAGLAVLDTTRNKVSTFRADPAESGALQSDVIYAIRKDVKSPNRLWIGTAAGGLSAFDVEAKTFETWRADLQNPSSLGDDDIFSIHQSDPDTLWLGTDGGGLNRFDIRTGKVTRYDQKKGFEATQIYGVLADQSGVQWLTTNGQGLIRFDPKSERFVHFTARNGLQGNEFAICAYYRARTGQLVVGGTHGFNVFRPEAIAHEEYEAPIVITDIKVMNRSLELGKPPRLLSDVGFSYRDSMFSLEFASLSFADPKRNRYEYVMEGLHEEWIATDHDQNFATFTSPPPGTYIFKVRPADRSPDVAPVASLVVKVGPPPWRTWWAYTIYALLVLGLVFTYVRYQEQRVAALEQKNRLQAVEHDLELTAAVQAGFLPERTLIDEDQIRLVGVYQPADKCSGDWWWYEAKEDVHWVLIGDVTGHGPGPAMVTAAVGTAFRVQGLGGGTDPSERLYHVNTEVIAAGRGRYQMMLSALQLDTGTGKFVFWSAGGLPAIRVGKEGKVTTHGAPGTPLGSATFKPARIEGKLNPGDRLVLLTDGIPELTVAGGRLFGLRRVSEQLKNTAGVGLLEASQTLLATALREKGQRPQEDDWTFVLVEWGPKLGPSAPAPT